MRIPKVIIITRIFRLVCLPGLSLLLEVRLSTVVRLFGCRPVPCRRLLGRSSSTSNTVLHPKTRDVRVFPNGTNGCCTRVSGERIACLCWAVGRVEAGGSGRACAGVAGGSTGRSRGGERFQRKQEGHAVQHAGKYCGTDLHAIPVTCEYRANNWQSGSASTSSRVASSSRATGASVGGRPQEERQAEPTGHPQRLFGLPCRPQVDAAPAGRGGGGEQQPAPTQHRSALGDDGEVTTCRASRATTGLQLRCRCTVSCRVVPRHAVSCRAILGGTLTYKGDA